MNSNKLFRKKKRMQYLPFLLHKKLLGKNTAQ